jgi:hypothetical protein
MLELSEAEDAQSDKNTDPSSLSVEARQDIFDDRHKIIEEF